MLDCQSKHRGLSITCTGILAPIFRGLPLCYSERFSSLNARVSDANKGYLLTNLLT